MMMEVRLEALEVQMAAQQVEIQSLTSEHVKLHQAHEVLHEDLANRQEAINRQWAIGNVGDVDSNDMNNDMNSYNGIYRLLI